MAALTLEQVRDGMREFVAQQEYAPLSSMRRWADAIDAELKARGEPVAYQARWRSHSNRPFGEWEEVDKDSYDAEVESPNKNWEFRALYTAPLAPKIEVTEATLRDWFNLLCHAGIDAEEENAPRTKFRIADVAKEVSHEIARFENAALKETP